MDKTDDTPATPLWFRALVWLLPAIIFIQFLNAGIGLFLALPVLALFAGALLIRCLRGFAGWAGAVVALYGVQFGLSAGAAPLLMAFHPANGALMFVASLVLLAKVVRDGSRGGRHKALLSNVKPTWASGPTPNERER